MSISNEDVVRELEKIEDTLVRCNSYLKFRDESNAMLHMSSTRYTPLTSAVGNALASIMNLRSRLEERETT